MQKLVNETFQKIWFTPTPGHDTNAITRKILNITDVVRTTSACDKGFGMIIQVRNILMFDIVIL